MVWRFKMFMDIYKEAKNAPEIPEVTRFFEKSNLFEKVVMKMHNLKLKIWLKLDEAAFPEEHQNKKYIE